MAAALLVALFAGFAVSGAVPLSNLWSGTGDRAAVAGPAPAPGPYAPRQLIIGFRPGLRLLSEIRSAGIAVTAAKTSSGAPDERVVLLARGISVVATAARIGRLPGITYAVPNYIAHQAGGWIPNDRGRTRHPRGWQRLQWNFMPTSGIDAPDAWRTLQQRHRPGAKGVKIAVLDTGAAFERWGRFRRSPDFARTRFTAPCDLVSGNILHGRCTNTHPLDRNGHGTFVTGVIAESTNNRIGVTGLAYRATVIPVRVLDGIGNGYATAIARGIRYAVQKGARVINLSIEFTPGTSAADIPSIVSAIHYAHRHGVILVAASGNDSTPVIAYPARDSEVISVGATTKDRCLAYYSNTGIGLDLVAPGGGDDAAATRGSDCHPNRNLPGVFQMTFNNPRHPNRFSLPGGWWGTSMSAPEVSAAAAMVIASRVIGRNPSPARVLRQLEYSATSLGARDPNPYYGYGLLNVAAAVATRAKPPSSTQTTTTPTATTPSASSG